MAQPTTVRSDEVPRKRRELVYISISRFIVKHYEMVRLSVCAVLFSGYTKAHNLRKFQPEREKSIASISSYCIMNLCLNRNSVGAGVGVGVGVRVWVRLYGFRSEGERAIYLV